MAKVEPFYNGSNEDYRDSDPRFVRHDESECVYGPKVLDGGFYARGFDGELCKRCAYIAKRREGELRHQK